MHVVCAVVVSANMGVVMSGLREWEETPMSADQHFFLQAPSAHGPELCF